MAIQVKEIDYKGCPTELSCRLKCGKAVKCLCWDNASKRITTEGGAQNGLKK